MFFSSKIFTGFTVVSKIVGVLVGCLFLSCSWAVAQNLGGRSSFNFVKLPQNPRIAALGGMNVSATTQDVNMFWQNPALAHADNHRQLSLNYTSYYAGISQLCTTFGWHHARTGNWSAGIQYLNYGTIQGYDALGNPTNSFSATDYALALGYAKQVGVFSLGGSIKFVNSQIAGYGSSALLVDMGGAFIHPKHDFRVGMVVKNVGFALSNYTAVNNFTMPFDVQVGTSFKPKKMPFRLSFTVHHFYPTDIIYDNPNIANATDENGNPIHQSPNFVEKLTSRFVVGTEIILSNSFQVRAGYNFLTRRELGIQGVSKGLTGLSLGFMLRLKAFECNYAYSVQHTAGAVHTIGLTVDTKKLFAPKNSN